MIFFVLVETEKITLATNRPHFQALSHFPPLSSSKEIRQRPWLDLIMWPPFQSETAFMGRSSTKFLSTGWLHTKNLSRREWNWTVVFSKWRWHFFAVFRRGCVRKGLRSEGAAFGSLSMLWQSWQKSLRHSSTFDHSREPRVTSQLQDVKTLRKMFLSLCKLGYGTQEFNSRKIHLYLTFYASWIKSQQVWKQTRTYFNNNNKKTVSLQALSSLQNLPN